MKTGTFAVTKDGLVEVPDKPIVYHRLGKNYIVNPEDPMYQTIKSYGDYDCVNDEGYASMKDAEGL